MPDMHHINSMRSELHHHFMMYLNKEYFSILCKIHSFDVKRQKSTSKPIKGVDIAVVADIYKPLHHWELGLIQDLILEKDKLCWTGVACTPCAHKTCYIIKLHPLEVCSCSHYAIEEMQKSSRDQLNTSRCPIHRAAVTARDPITT